MHLPRSIFARRSSLALATAVATVVAAVAAPLGAQPPEPGGAVPARAALSTRPAFTTDSALAFGLRDQFGRRHDAASYRGRAVVIVGAGRAGRAAGTEWVQLLRGLQADTSRGAAVPVVPVADLRGVPRLLRRIVRGRFPTQPDQAVLLDWDGAVAEQFGFDRERCTILIVGPAGRAHAQMSTSAVDSVLAREILRRAGELGPPAVVGPTP
jgi:hypothetical protein